MFDQYICTNCGKGHLVQKKYGEDWLPEVEVTCECSETATIAKRDWNKKLVVSICEGSVGNASNGYTNTQTYHPSSLTPNPSKAREPFKKYSTNYVDNHPSSE